MRSSILTRPQKCIRFPAHHLGPFGILFTFKVLSPNSTQCVLNEVDHPLYSFSSDGFIEGLYDISRSSSKNLRTELTCELALYIRFGGSCRE